MQKVNIAEKLAQIDAYWTPSIAGSLNGQHIKLAKLKGEFVWHRHDDADEMFLVISGKLLLRMREGDVMLEPGEFYIVPKGVEHLPVANEEVQLMLFEPAGTLNTGNLRNERTIDDPSHI